MYISHGWFDTVSAARAVQIIKL